MLKKIIVNRDYHNSRFDRWFKHNVLNIPQSLLEKLIRKNKIKLKNKKIKTSYRVQYQDIIEIYGIEKSHQSVFRFIKFFLRKMVFKQTMI